MTKRPSRRKGSLLMIVAGGLLTLAATASLVVDLGLALQARAQRQAAVDAAALAACHALLPPVDQTLATNEAILWAGRNGCTLTAADVSFKQQANGRTAVTVTSNSDVPTTFGRLLGINTMKVRASASAGLGGLRSLPKGYMPFAIPATKQADGSWTVLDLDDKGKQTYVSLNASPPPKLILKSNKSTNGNFQALAFSGSGANDLHDEIVNGSETSLEIGDKVTTEPGNKTNQIKNGLEDRYKQNPDIIVPLMDQSEWAGVTGRSDVTIRGFLVARLDPIPKNGDQFTATLVSLVISAPASLDANNGAGGYAPLLISAP